MTQKLKVACIQLSSTPVIQENLDKAGELIRTAAAEGATLIATPENTCHIRMPSKEKLTSAHPEETHPGIPFFSDLAKELGVYILAGSFAIKVSEDKLYNRSYLFGADGEIIAKYDKIHLFDVELGRGESYKESEHILPGEKAVIADTPQAKIGLSICYDLRFAYLYRDLAKLGASILAVPAAFTVPTGKAHWETLLRARAIETGSFVIAPGQTGEHENGRHTWGHSLIINPWGEVLADAGSDIGYITAELDLNEVKEAREKIPALQHDREYKT